jgi:hypothetical protein
MCLKFEHEIPLLYFGPPYYTGDCGEWLTYIL